MIPRQPSQSSSARSSQSSDARPADRRRRRSKAKRKQHRRLNLEGLETRQLLAANPIGGGAIPTIDEFDGPRNIGTVAAFPVIERESAGEIGANDSFNTAQEIPLGNGPGDRNTIDLSGSASFTPGTNGFATDVDTYRMELDAGDILDISTLGAVSTFTVYREITTPGGFTTQQLWFSQDAPSTQTIFYPFQSPLQTLGNARAAQVVPGENAQLGFTQGVGTGVYYVQVSTEGLTGNYTLGLRTYRPVTESLPAGTAQKVFLDFDGGMFPRDEFNFDTADPGIFIGGMFRFSPFQQILEDIGVQVASPIQYNTLIDDIVADIEQQFTFLGQTTSNGLFSATGNPGDFGIEILNSKDHPDPGFRPDVTRVVFGAEAEFPEIDLGGTLGFSQTIDVGNFGLDDYVLSIVDALGPSGAAIPRSPSLSAFDAIAREVAVTTTHELAHSFGLYHTVNTNLTASIIDAGGGDNNFNQAGVGFDGILGTFDDTQPAFVTDLHDPASSGISFGTQFSGESLAHTLATGTSGGGLTGRAFLDSNRDGNFSGDVGLAGVTVYLDINGNGVQDSVDPQTITGVDGSYSLFAAPGTYTLTAIAPDNFLGTSTGLNAPSTISRPITVTTAGGSGGNFGFFQVNPDITGRKFADLNNDGVSDPSEPGIEGAFIFADLDGDNLPDIGEPFDITDADGNYTLDLPIGSYAIREVEEPGFERTIPLSGEYLINYTGGPLGNNFDFGGLPSRDFGDAPASYQTTIDDNGPSHGITVGLTIGSQVDRELDGAPSLDASGDDLTGTTAGQIDDEDGVVNTVQLRPGATGQFQVTLNNTTGSTAYLQGWVDLNADGDFNDANEQFITNDVRGSGTHTFGVTLPASFDINADGTADGIMDTFTRFRYSLTPDLGFAGPSDTGEVEDHPVRIVAGGGGLANDDQVSVPRNSIAFPIDVLANDFSPASNPLTIVAQGTSATLGVVAISQDANGAQQLIYTPPTNFVGLDTIRYRVTDSNGNEAEAVVSVTVTFQTAVPIAIDDIYEVPSTESGFPLNVLDNDIASINGGLTISSVNNGSRGGIVRLGPGNQSVRYTPADGFTGSEQFRYTVQDAAGNFSSAFVTVVLTPQSLEDDLAEFKIEVLEQNNDTEVLTLQSGDIFRVRVSVDDLRTLPFQQPQGIASAFTDLLYTSDLVQLVDTNPNDQFPFDITFGPKFETPGGFQLGDNLTPGLVDEVGSTQSLDSLNSVLNPVRPDVASHTGFEELFTVTMQATGTGVVLFQTDPTEAAVSETVLINTNEALTFDQIRYGSVEVEIAPSGDGFPVAIDDTFTVAPGSVTPIDVLLNDLIGPNDTLIEFGLREDPANGDASILLGNTRLQDRISYSPEIGFQGYDELSYVITVSSPDFGIVTSIANVSIVVGAIQDPQVFFDFTLVDEAGNEITSNQINVGQRFGVEIDGNNLTSGRIVDPDTVFAGFMDVLYDAGRIVPTNEITGDEFDFDVVFDQQFNELAAVGTNNRAGLIDEFGSLLETEFFTDDDPASGKPNRIATLFFRAIASGQATVAGSPADRFPFQDTLLGDEDQPVPVSQISYDSITFNISGSGEPLQNSAMPADVNGDNVVSAIDALLVINAMSNDGASGEFNASGPVHFHDVNGDKRISAVDALQVINILNSGSASGEEIVAAVAPTTSANSSVDTTDADNESLAEVLPLEEKVVGGQASSPTTVANEVSSSTATQDESSDDDWLSLLADDVSDQWS